MRLVSGRPLWDGPERIHQTTRAIGKFVGEPPLVAERSVCLFWHALKVGDPIKRSEGCISVRGVTRLGIIKRLSGRQPRRVAVTTLIWIGTAERFAISLLRRYQRTINLILRPAWGRFHPFNQFAGIFFPRWILVGVQPNLTGIFKSNDLIHVVHTGIHIFEVTHPNI